ncbi:leucine-rich repeat protein FLOR 1-like [Punica granatum]|uniref:Leucine-rich repeat protein FLOR 1-like n=1 Tax=Punica granatum TaxID=22663 RepID=A0A6P8EB31_PUNGR|nr:leucine-rich repeat protein FLOR 1-like [Punica granatum]
MVPEGRAFNRASNTKRGEEKLLLLHNGTGNHTDRLAQLEFKAELVLLGALHLCSTTIHFRLCNTISNLKSLTLPGIGSNNFVGVFPSSIFNKSSMEVLDVVENHLVGSLPSDLGFTIPVLQILFMSKNRFIGIIPKSLSNLFDLFSFDIALNN